MSNVTIPTKWANPIGAMCRVLAFHASDPGSLNAYLPRRSFDWYP